MALPKNTGVLLPASTAASSKTSPAVSSISSSSTVLCKRRVVELAANRRVVQAADGNRRAKFAADRALEQMHLARLAVEHAAKIKTVANGPVHRKRADAEHALQFIQQRERILHRAVALVHEGEDRHAALAADLEQLARLRLDAFARNQSP